jgi:Transposase DDE domain
VHIKKDLSFTGLRKRLSRVFCGTSDGRDPEKTCHTIHDVMMSGLAMMYFQEPSLLQFQRSLDDEAHTNNLKTLFQVASIPKDSQMRDVIDEIDPEEIGPAFNLFFRPLQRGKHLEKYRVFNKYYVASIDGSEYFGSEAIHCPGCLKAEKKTVRFAHKIVQPALMKPGIRQVIPLVPEEVRNTDGSDKQDCEINAGKRLLVRMHRSHPKLSFIIVGDSLYSKQPMMEEILILGNHYVLVAKPTDHKKLMEWVDEMRLLSEVIHMEFTDRQGLVHVYEWINDVPLNDNKKTLAVNYVEYWIKEGDRTTYHNSWVTDLAIDDDNVEELVRIGRCRWKIENEVFNTLKNQGYHIEHNYGHGKKRLSFNFFLLNLLAFFMHQIFELTDPLYMAVRKKCGSKQAMWERLRSLLTVLIFQDWETLLQRVLTPMRFL